MQLKRTFNRQFEVHVTVSLVACRVDIFSAGKFKKSHGRTVRIVELQLNLEYEICDLFQKELIKVAALEMMSCRSLSHQSVTN